MRVFKPKYCCRDGPSKTVKNWYLEFRDHLGIVRKLAAWTNKQQTQTLGRKIEKLIIFKMNSEPPDRELSEWLEHLDKRIKNRLVKIGIIDQRRAAAGKAIIEHIDDFKKSLGDTRHARQTAKAIQRIFDACGFSRWSDISASRLQSHISGLDVSQRTRNFYLKAAKQFAKWMIRDRRASESPIEHLRTKTITERKVIRRAFELDEMRYLLDVTENQPERFGMSGHARGLLYRLAAETGLRANELRTLSVAAFGLQIATVSVAATNTKAKKSAVIPLRPETSALLKAHLSGKQPNERAFNFPEKPAQMLKADLEAAREKWTAYLDKSGDNQTADLQNDFLKYIDSAGRRADFHSLRHTTGSWLAAAGVHPKIAQQILRHSDINLTLSCYTHTLLGQESEAISALPNLSTKKESKQCQA